MRSRRKKDRYGKFTYPDLSFDSRVCFGCAEPIQVAQAKKGSSKVVVDEDPAVPLAVKDGRGTNCWVHLRCYEKAQALLSSDLDF